VYGRVRLTDGSFISVVVTPPILVFWSRNSSPAACIPSPIVSDSVVGRRGLTLPRLHGRQLHSRANCWGMQAGVTNGDRHTHGLLRGCVARVLALRATGGHARVVVRAGGVKEEHNEVRCFHLEDGGWGREAAWWRDSSTLMWCSCATCREWGSPLPRFCLVRP
jgi:hypothetical protein